MLSRLNVVTMLLLVSCAFAGAQDKYRTNKNKPARFIPFKEFESLPQLKGVIRTTDEIGEAMWAYGFDSTTAAFTSTACQQLYPRDTFRIVFETPVQEELHWSFCGLPNDKNLEILIGEYENPRDYGYAAYEVCISRALLYYLAAYDSTFEYRLIRRAYLPLGTSKLSESGSYDGRSSKDHERINDYIETDDAERKLFKWTQPFELIVTKFQVQSIARLATYLQNKLNGLIVDTELDKKVKFPVSVGVFPLLSYDGRPSYLDKGKQAYVKTNKGIDSGTVTMLTNPSGSYGSNRYPAYASIEKPAPSKYDQPVEISFYLNSFIPLPEATPEVTGLYLAFRGTAPPSFLDVLGEALVKIEQGNQEHAKTVTNSATGTMVNFRIGSITKSVSISGIVESASPGKYVEIKVVSVNPPTSSNGKLWQYNGKNIQNNEKIIVLTDDISSP